MESIVGGFDLKGHRVAVVVARWNEFVTKQLQEGAVEALEGCGATVTVVVVPGTWEIPPVVAQLAKSGKFSGAVALGCILQGATTHAALLASDVSKALMAIQVETGFPVSWGVLTPESQDQAIERSGMKMGNKGREAAMALAEMVSLLAKLASMS